MCAFQTDLPILKDYDAHFFQAHSSEKRTLITGTEVSEFFFSSNSNFDLHAFRYDGCYWKASGSTLSDVNNVCPYFTTCAYFSTKSLLVANLA